MTIADGVIVGHTAIIRSRLDSLRAAIVAADPGGDLPVTTLDDVKFQFDRVLRAVQKLERAVES